jgi:hypothetical protein
MLKSFLKIAAIALAVLIAGPATSWASIEVGDEITLGNGIGGPGGIFIIDNLTDAAEPNFDTFCVELFEFINFGPTYVVDGIGLTAQLSNRPLGTFAAWLYSRFLGVGGTLTGFNAADPLDVNAVQRGIWGGGDAVDAAYPGMGYTSAQINPYINAAQHDAALLASLKTQYDSDVANFLWAGTGDIFIMNLVRKSTGLPAQDQLVRIPPITQPPVPEPLSLVVWSMLAACVGATARRTRR